MVVQHLIVGTILYIIRSLRHTSEWQHLLSYFQGLVSGLRHEDLNNHPTRSTGFFGKKI